MAEKLKIISLGGLNEIGKNITVLEYGGDMIVVDCGLGFPDLFSMPYNHHPQVISGVMETECAGLLRDFFRSLRIRKKSGETPANIDKSTFSGYDK